jgi:hypothetical protein
MAQAGVRWWPRDNLCRGVWFRVHKRNSDGYTRDVCDLPFDVTQRGPWTIDVGGLTVTFAVEDCSLRAWVDVERQRGVWARQELRPSSGGGWRLVGDVFWHDDLGEAISVSARVRSRPGISSQIKNIGPMISARELLPRWLIDALDAADFMPRGSSGRERGAIASQYNEKRARKRDDIRRGLVEPREFPKLEAMLWLGPDEQLGELRAAGLSDDEQREWVRIHGLGPLTPANRRIYRRVLSVV